MNCIKSYCFQNIMINWEITAQYLLYVFCRFSFGSPWNVNSVKRTTQSKYSVCNIKVIFTQDVSYCFYVFPACLLISTDIWKATCPYSDIKQLVLKLYVQKGFPHQKQSLLIKTFIFISTKDMVGIIIPYTYCSFYNNFRLA